MSNLISVNFGGWQENDNSEEIFNYKEKAKGVLYDPDTLRPLSVNNVDSLPSVINDVKNWTQTRIDKTVNWLAKEVGIRPVDGYNLQADNLYFPIYDDRATLEIRGFAAKAKKITKKQNN
jgi:hypothetical protein